MPRVHTALESAIPTLPPPTPPLRSPDMQDTNNDPLTRLVASHKEVNRGRLADVLAQYVTVDPEHQSVEFRPNVKAQLGKKGSTLVMLLGQKALTLLTQGQDVDEGLAPKELSTRTGILGNTLRPLLRTLVGDGVAVRRPDGRYVVPNHALDAVERAIHEERERS